MQPHLKPRIEKATRKEFPHGIQAYGTDALRFTFAALATTGRDIRFDLGRVEGYRNFCNKLWNASRFALMHLEKPVSQARASETPALAERWIRSRLCVAIGAVHENLATYRLDLAAKAIYEFIWYEFCDWYLELAKPVLNDEAASPERLHATRACLVDVLETALRVLHPLMPFLTEEIWQRVAPLAGRSGETIMLQPFPSVSDYQRDEAAEREMQWLQGFILGIRQIRGEMDISPAKPLPVLVLDASGEDRRLLETHAHLLQTLARAESIRLLENESEAPPAATALLGATKLLVPMAGLIDIEAEWSRLSKQREKQRTERERAAQKLANESFVSRAPAAVVEKEKLRLAELDSALGELDERLERLRELRAETPGPT